MRRALALARRGAGRTAPNPMVGCVLTDADGGFLAEGFHERFGGDHAEVSALRQLKDPARLTGGTAYVTLEPCSHHGKTPPCAPLVASSGVARVVIGMRDPNPAVDGRGIALLRAAGIEVVEGVLADECEQLNEAWIHHMATGLPFVTLKIAQTADGYVADEHGESKWITGETSRRIVHAWRAEMDAVMVGRRTAIQDNPSLTVRLVEGRQPRRIVLDGPLELPRSLNVLSDAHEEKTILVTWNAEQAARLHDPMLKMLQTDYFRGQVLTVPRTPAGHVDLSHTLRELGRQGITSLLVEGGQGLSSALIRENLADRVRIFIAPKLLGGGVRSLAGIGVQRLQDLRAWRRTSWSSSGEDQLLTLDA